jgi:hypothetical protein
MKRFHPFIDREVNQDALRDAERLRALGIEARYVPDEIEEFDELEYGFTEPAGNRTIIFTTVLEQSKLKRVSLGYIPEGGAKDAMHAFSETELAAVLAKKGDTLTRFFEMVTAG